MSIGLADLAWGSAVMTTTVAVTDRTELLKAFDLLALLALTMAAAGAWAGAPRTAYAMGWAVLGLCVSHARSLMVSALFASRGATAATLALMVAVLIAALLYAVLGATGSVAAALAVPGLAFLAVALGKIMIFRHAAKQKTRRSTA